MACTTILVGKNATYDGSTLMARNEDSGAGHFCEKCFCVVKPDQQPRKYVSVISKVEIELPNNPMRYTAMPNALPDEGVWAAAGINEANVAMTATETLTSNPRVLGADPLVAGGIGEEDMVTITLPYIRSAREGVERLGALIEKYGTYEINGIGFQDVNEVWWLESIGGRHWMAKRVPDDKYVVAPNQQAIDSFDFVDAYGEKCDHLCAPDLKDFVVRNHLDRSMEGASVAENSCFDARGAFGSRSDSDHSYNTPRAWFMLRYLSPNAYDWQGNMADYTPESDNLPWSLSPDRKITVEDVKYVLSSYYQGTPFNPYAQHGDPNERGRYRPIGINRNNFVSVTQLRPYAPEEIMAVEWIAMGSNAFNELVPVYTNVDVAPEYLATTGKNPSTDSFYWTNRIIGALADAHYAQSIAHIERYQSGMACIGHQMLNQFDREYSKEKNAPEYLAECNGKIIAEAKRRTEKLLSDVLFTASCGMKNGFARSDA